MIDRSPFKLIFVHGYTASHLTDWYPQISAKLEKLKIDFAIPDFPGGKHPKAEEWLEIIHGEVLKTNKPLVFVGHSLGTRAVLLYLEKYHPRVKAIFLVAAFANSIENAKRHDGEAYPDFFEHKIDLEKIKPLVEQFIVVHSKDDSSINFEQATEIAGELNADLIMTQGRDHFSAPKNAPYILEILRRKLNF